MSRRSLSDRTTTQTFGEDGENPENTDADVNEMVEGLINSLEDEKRSSRVLVEDVYSYSPSPGFADDPDELLGAADYNNHLRRATGSTHNRRKCLLRTVIVITFMSLVALASLLIAYSAKSSTSSASSTTSTSSSPPATASSIPIPPDDIFIWCSQGHMISEGNSDTCQQVCQLAACCFDEERSCFSQGKEICAQYTVCLALQSLPPFNSSTSTVETDTASTVETDSAGAASNQTTTSIPEPFVPQKLGRAPIEKLSATCNSTAALDACSETCSPALCCFDSDVQKNCYSHSNNFATCNAYSKYCYVLGGQFSGQTPVDSNAVDQISNESQYYYYNETINDLNQTNQTNYPTTLMQPPDQLESDCFELSQMPEGGEADAFNICRNTCTDGYCCFSEGDDNCRANNPDVCAKYDICVFAGIVFTPSSSIPNPPSNISDICSPQSVQDPNAYSVCEKICNFANCCFAESELCINVDKTQCGSYQSCLNLQEMNSEPGDIPLNNATTPNSTDAGSLTTESEGVLVNATTDLTPNSTDAGSLTTGSEGVLVNATTDLTPNSTVPEGLDNTTTEVPLEAPQENLAIICELALTQPFTPNLDECQNACGKSSCCVDLVAESNCYGLYPEICQLFSPCKSINPAYSNFTSSEPTTPLSPPPEDLTTRCTGIADQVCQRIVLVWFCLIYLLKKALFDVFMTFFHTFLVPNY